ncbi:MAG: aminodeoxychorismate/anthranilate synthase component II [Planctomycetota bacterium]
MILVLDNEDSFVHNLARYLRQSGAETRVVRSHDVDARDVLRSNPDAVVLSPGPHGPDQAGCCMELIRIAPARLPILGVCLGHQVIAAAYGGRVVRGTPRHGMASEIEHDASSLFHDCPNPMSVARYHSLVVSRQGLPRCLSVTAVSRDDQAVMAIRHRERPVYGLQFHPESILSPFGMQMISNFGQVVAAT